MRVLDRPALDIRSATFIAVGDDVAREVLVSDACAFWVS
jgi:hypothetical protein